MTIDDTQIIINTVKTAVPWDVVAYAGPVVKLTMIISLIAGGAALVLALLRKVSNGRHSGLLGGLGWTGILFGLLGGLYAGAMSYVAAKATGITRLVVLLPSIIEVIYAVLFGLLALAIASWGNAGAKRT